MAFQFPPSISVAHLPTAIEPLKQLSKELDGPQIFIKRDDLTGCALSGNKIRKLEFVAADALKKEADTLITCGGIQSNHARATAVLATRLGLKSLLVLKGQAGEVPDGNLFLARLVGAEIRTITEEDYRARVNEIMEEFADQLRSRGRKPYVIPEGASNALGAVGYLKAFKEIMEHSQKMKLKLDAIICAVGSGGTYAGLLIGKFLYQQNVDIYGFNVCDDEAYFVKRIWDIIEQFRQAYAVNLPIRQTDIRIIDGYVGEGYALSRQEEIDVIKRVALREGIILDAVYTGKAMFGLLDQIKKDRFTKNQSILFLHSGGIFGLFPKRGLFF